MDGGLRKQLVRGVERGLEVPVQTGAVQARERERLEIAPAALGRQRALGVARLHEVRLARIGVPDLELRARERRAELRVGLEPVGRQDVDQGADRVAPAADEEVEPVLGDELDREVPFLRGDGVLERLRAHPAGRVPACGARVQDRQLGPQLAPGARAQQLREQTVVAVPLAARVDADHEPVRAFEVGQDVPTGIPADQGIGQLATDAVDQ